ncbi:MAG: gamma-glutamyl-gamma-aminobutyrate hydrolase family protein [Actinomycetota bacterium]
MEPLIAMVGQPVPAGKVESWKEDSVAIPGAYLRALHRAGGQEAILSPHRVTNTEADELVSRFEGVLLIGGGDIDPTLYGEDPLPECYGIDSEADLFEMNLVRSAVRRDLPVLAVCRGIQVLNVSLGGTLDQHITGRPGTIGHGIPGTAPQMHPVRLEPGSWTAKAIGAESAECSSSHHQALADLGDGLSPVGWTEDGVVEAVEHSEGGWVVGVQWHPERTAEADPAQQGLFDALVEQAASR